MYRYRTERAHGRRRVPARRPGSRPLATAIAALFVLAAAAACTSSASATPAAVVTAAPSVTAPVASAPATSPATPTSTPAASPSATLSLSATTGPVPPPSVALCAPSTLAARITLWEGATGHRIAHVELTNTGTTTSCLVQAMSQPQLVDGHGSVIIDGAPASASAALTMAPGAVLRTLVQDGNYCGPAPAAPVTVAFVLGGGAGRIVAAPVSSTDTQGVPPCLGSAGSAGDIEMQPWGP